MKAGIYRCTWAPYQHWFEVHSGLHVPDAATFMLRTGRCFDCYRLYSRHTPMSDVVDDFDKLPTTVVDCRPNEIR